MCNISKCNFFLLHWLKLLVLLAKKNKYSNIEFAPLVGSEQFMCRYDFAKATMCLIECNLFKMPPQRTNKPPTSLSQKSKFYANIIYTLNEEVCNRHRQTTI